MRLNKYLADAGIASRRKADELIAAGKVQVNGEVAIVGQQIDPAIDEITVDQTTVDQQQQELVYIALHKPTGYVTSSKATKQEPKIVMQLVDTPTRVFPVGRLDKDTSGLLILTNDGLLANELTNPAVGSEKEYEVTLDAPLTAERIRKIEAGVRLDHRATKPTEVKPLGQRKARVILREGKNRQVRKIFGKVGCEVKTLKRLRVKGLWLPKDLRPGEWRTLTTKEICLLHR